jgi:hypothetical protein
MTFCQIAAHRRGATSFHPLNRLLVHTPRERQATPQSTMAPSVEATALSSITGTANHQHVRDDEGGDNNRDDGTPRTILDGPWGRSSRPAAWPLSHVPSIWSRVTAQLARLDDLERRLHGHVSRSRRRAQNVLDRAPSHRRSHLRLFLTHGHERRTGMWTLCIEGRLLVGNKDHANAALVDAEGVLSVRAQGGVHRARGTPGAEGAEGEDGEGGGGGDDPSKASPPTDAPLAAAATAASNNAAAAAAAAAAITDRTPDRNQYKMGEKEEDPVEPLLFTHFFDTLEVTFRTIYQPKVLPPEAPSQSSSPVKKSRSAKRKAVQQDATPAVVRPQDLSASAPTKFRWTKDSGLTEDSHAFWVRYNNHFSERPPPPNMKFHSVVADVRLYPTRPEPGENETDANSEPIYRVSTGLAGRFFAARHSTTTAATTSSNGTGNDGGGTARPSASSSSPSSSPAPKRRKLDPDHTTSTEDDDEEDEEEEDDDDSSSGGQPQEDDKKKNSSSGSSNNKGDKRKEAIPVDNYIDVPSLLTYSEIVLTFYQYVQDRRLHDPTDRSLIVCDEALEDALGVGSFNFSQLHQILTDGGLITRVDADEEPIVVTYLMNEKTASPQAPPGCLEEEDDPPAAATTTAAARKSTTRATTAAAPPAAEADPDHHPSVLSFDIDVALPALFNYRSRELLRRLKRREFEYTSSRTKARYLLVASKGNEEIVKTKIEQCISGQGYQEENAPVFLALAKAAAAGSEARTAAQIDARTCDLIGRVDGASRRAATAWEAVDSLRRAMGIAPASDDDDNDGGSSV